MAGQTVTQRYLIEFQTANQQAVLKALKDLDVTSKKFDDSTKKLGKSSEDLAGRFAKLAIRSATVVPIWMAIRGVWVGLTGTIRDGIKYFIDLDKAIARALAVVEGVDDMKGAAESLRIEFQDLAVQSGETVTKVAEAFHRFASAGFDVQTSLAGMNISVKTAVGVMGDAEETARTIADVYNLMKDKIQGAVTVQDKMNMVGATLATLWGPNVFELSEFNSALTNFTGIAKNFNLTFDEMMALVGASHTLMQRGARAGTELSRTFQSLASNIGEAEVILGRYIDLTKESVFDVYLELLKKLNAQYGDSAAKVTKIMEVFGKFGGRVSAAFAANLDKLITELERLQSMTLEDRMERLNDLFELQTLTLQRQLNIFKELKSMTVEAFLTGITGSDDYVEALRGVNEILKNDIIPGATAAGFAISEMFIQIGAGWRYLKAVVRPWIDKARGKTPQKTDLDAFIAEEDKNAEERARRLYERLNRVREEIRQRTSGTPPGGGAKPPADEEEKRIDPITRFSDLMKLVSEDYKFQVQQADLLQIYGYDAIQVEQAKLALMLQREDRLKKEEELTAQILKIQQLINQEVIKYSTELQSAFKGTLSDLLKGKLTGGEAVSQFFERYRDIQIESVSEGLSQLLIGKTGIGGAFGELNVLLKSFTSGNRIGSPIQMAFTQGANQTYQAIVRGFRDGLSGRTMGAGGLGAGGGGGILGSLLGMLGLGGTGYSQMQGVRSNGQPISINERGTGLLSRMGGWGGVGQGVLGGLMSGLSTFQAAGGGGRGALLGGMSGIGSLMMSIPTPWTQGLGMLLSLGGMFGGMFGRKKERSVEERHEEYSVASKIDVTNKELSIVNRNLVAMKNMWAEYILPSSAYFSESRNISDQFSLHARRGLA